MKKTITVIMTIGVIILAIALGSIMANNGPKINQLPNKNTGIDARQFSKVEWPTTGMVAEIPSLRHFTSGEVLMNDEDFCGLVGYSSTDAFRAYVDACENEGYIEEYYDTENYSYYGVNSEGSTILLDYNQQDDCIVIRASSQK